MNLQEARLAEKRRLRFIEQRDGAEGTREFAVQTLRVYRAQARPVKGRKSYAHQPNYRVSYIGSLLVLREYLRDR